MAKITILLVAAAGACLVPGIADSQPAAPVPAAPQHFLYEAEQRRELIEQELRQRKLLPEPAQPRSSPPAAPVIEQPAPDAPCWYLAGVSLAGNSLIPAQRLQQAVQPHLSPCLSPGQINRLLAAITQVYMQAGYVASRPLLLAPPEHGQPLKLAIEEGFVEAIELAGEDLPIDLGAAFPGMVGEPLQLRQLEQGLDQLNRLRSVDLTAHILPGDLPGGSRIVLQPLSRPARWQLGAGLDNSGSAGTGRNRANLSLALDSPLERNDFLMVYGNRSHASENAGSVATGVYYNIPYGPWGLSVSANHFRYRTLPAGRAGQLNFSGSSSLFSYSLERSLWRDQHRLLSANVRLDDKSAEARLQGQRLAVQSPRYRTLELGINGLWQGSATWVGYLGYARGLGGWAANHHLVFKQPNAQTAYYGKWRASLSRTAAYGWHDLRWALSSTVQAQYSAQRMPSLEALSLASGNQVRGFQRGGVDSDRGVAWSNTLHMPFSLPFSTRLIPSLGLDAGWADGKGKKHPGERLLGAAAALNVEHRFGNVIAEYQHSLYRRNGRTDPGYWRLGMQVHF